MRGKVAIVQVDFDRFAEHKRNLYSPDWTRVPSSLLHPTGGDVPKSANLAEMLDIASRLGEEFDFVRVDLYALGQRIVLRS
jgi:teichuronopeptide biosynthesis TupA-like protein